MKKSTFLNELSNRINKYPDHNEIIQYYNELIQDKIDEGMDEDDAVASLGTIDEICKNIEEQRGSGRNEEEVKEAVSTPVVTKTNTNNNNTTNEQGENRINGGKRFVFVLWVIGTVFMCIASIIVLIVAISFMIGTIAVMASSALIAVTSVSMASFQFGIGLFLFGMGIIGLHYAKVLVKFIFHQRPNWTKNVRKGLTGE